MSNSEAIFTQQDIDLFKMDHSKYTLTITQLKPVVLEHVGKKNENFNIRTSNINQTVEVIQGIADVDSLFRYMQNKLNKYEAMIDERTIKSKIQEQV